MVSIGFGVVPPNERSHPKVFFDFLVVCIDRGVVVINHPMGFVEFLVANHERDVVVEGLLVALVVPVHFAVVRAGRFVVGIYHPISVGFLLVVCGLLVGENTALADLSSISSTFSSLSDAVLIDDSVWAIAHVQNTNKIGAIQCQFISFFGI